MESEKCSQSDSRIRYRTLVDLCLKQIEITWRLAVGVKISPHTNKNCPILSYIGPTESYI